jgi:hypothetical protein
MRVACQTGAAKLIIDHRLDYPFGLYGNKEIIFKIMI